MHGQPPHFRPNGGGRGRGRGRGSGVSYPPQQQQIHLNPNMLPNPNLFIIQPNHSILPQFNPFFQNPNRFPQVPQQLPNTSIPVALNSESSSFQAPHLNEYNNSKLAEQHDKTQNEMVEKVDKAARGAWKELLNSNKSVSAWKVSQGALLAVKAESWESLGFQMQQVPSLKSLVDIEGKINAFIHCFVAARRITSLHDLEVAICESEGVKQFEELELGPLVQYPLAVHYFSLTSNVTEVYRIRTEEIISFLCQFIDFHKKKEVKVDNFLDFICKKQSVSGWENLCVRVQDFRLYVDRIKQAKQSEDNVLAHCYEKLRKKARKHNKKRPLFSVQKKELDDHFNTISQRLKSFSSKSSQFCGEHIRFKSSSSEDDDSEENQDEDNQDEKNIDPNCNLPLPNGRSEHVSSCPYPSANEEMRRLGLKSEVEPTSYTPASCNMDNMHSRGKRRYENMSPSTSLPRKLRKKEKYNEDTKLKGSGNQSINGHSISIESLKIFVTTWKEACRDNNTDEILDRMLQFYNIRRKRKVKEMFSSYPFVGLLYAAVACIKLGLWDSMYDTFQTFSHHNINDEPVEDSADYISIDVQSVKKHATDPEPEILAHKHDIVAEDIAKKISEYFMDDAFACESPSRENKFHLLRKLRECEYWLIEQYSADKFESLGNGEYFTFLEKYIHLLPHALQNHILGDVSENVSLEAHLLPIQLDVLLSQALDSFQENGSVSIQNISELLARQFPLVCFKLVNGDFKENIKDFIREKRCNLTSNSVLFSIPLSRPTNIGDLSAQNEEMEDTSKFTDHAVRREGVIAPVTSRYAIDVLLKAPMLTDLKLWSHWDILFAPYLGSIVEWLLKEVNSKELQCLVTKDGKVIRLDHLATVDSFLKALIQESPFETAVQLLSLFALYGGEQTVPLSLLKTRAHKAFEVIINNYLEMEFDNRNPLMRGNFYIDPSNFGKSTSNNSDSKFLNNRSITNKAAPVLSRFILDSLSYLPVEFCSLAADVLIAGLQSFVNNVPAAILAECKQIEERLILHEVGLSLGLLEWVNDHQSFCSVMAGFTPSSFCLDTANSEPGASSVVHHSEIHIHHSLGEMPTSCMVDDKDKSVSAGVDSANHLGCTEQLLVLDYHIDKDPTKFIMSIRQEEFGLSECLSASENSMLKKQHARLGRALHCLSQELYSQDSHFILELVQNADDNIYAENVEPTLTFILHEKGIVLLNNEHGFSFDNIRALCDVGNSTKKGSNTGYIGKKGIGFKSVFRVTDAPEIHSNGFHIKFDITEGQIGFVLPTVIPPCDIDFYTRLASTGSDLHGQKSWNTCIVLPFRSSLLEGFAMNNILSMFSDLHPSLLLFLHRLQCIKFRNLLNDSFIVMRKEVMGNGIVEVALGNQRLTWFVASKKLKVDMIRSDVQTTEISLAFTLEQTGKGYVPILNQQPVFSFLPLRTYGLKFILQGDFVLPSSREEVDRNSPWNQWLLSEFPDLFVSAEKSVCSLPCYKNSPAKAITVFMSFVPLVGEVHGFFSTLPRRIISKLRMSNCLLLEDDENKWVSPCEVLRNWTDQSRSLLPDSLLHEHLGLGFLNKDIVLSESLAKALGVEECGPTVLIRFISSLCCSEDGLKSMGFGWLTSWLSTIYVMSSQLFMQTPSSYGIESDVIINLQKIPFIPLSDGKYSSVDEGTIWLHSESVGQGINDECLLKTFPKLYAKLRIVNPSLLVAASSIDGSCSDTSIIENAARMLYKIGVQRLSIHDIVKSQILPAISDDKNAVGQEELMTEYLAFAMIHLQSSCANCSLERGMIMTELHEKALILTNFGFKRSNEVAIHFNPEYGNSVDVDRLIDGLDIKWHKIDAAYIRHPITKSISDGVLKWRSFLQEIGVTDFVQVVEVDKSDPQLFHFNSKDVLQSKEIMSIDSAAKNWESQELFNILSWIASRDDREKSIYLLEILDRLWDDSYSDKVPGYHNDMTGERKPFKSSFICLLQNCAWMVSSFDNNLHYPKDLFHDCVAVNSIFGSNSPCTIPKVRSTKLLTDIGLKTEVTLDDALSILRLWKKSGAHFKASVSQMSNFYAYLWKEMPRSKKKILEELHSGPFIFVPNTSSFSDEDAVLGCFMSPQEVYWHDTIGSVDLIKSVHPQCDSTLASSPQIKMLHSFYPHFHDFFVNECGVHEGPPFSSYLQILLVLSSVALPHQAAKRVLEVFLIWDDALRSGSMSSEDVEFLKESLLKKENTVLPTKQDKWVSLHSAFGLICWSDDDKLGREFKHLKGVDFLCFGESSFEDNRTPPGKISLIMQRLGIPALSEIVTREAIPFGIEDSSSISSLVNWVLPYAQRYIFNAEPDKYLQLKQSCFENLRHLKIVVVEKLFHRYKIKQCDITSRRRHQCNCLLQDNILYCCQESDSHSIFLELSCVLFDGTPQLHLANFLLMITTMAQSGATQEQTEFFILNSQKVPKLPAEESSWSLQYDDENSSVKVEDLSSLAKCKSVAQSNWPPVDWKNAPGFPGLKTTGSNWPKLQQGDCAENNSFENTDAIVDDISSDLNIEVNSTAEGAVLVEAEVPESQSNVVASNLNVALDSVDVVSPDNKGCSGPSVCSEYDRALAQQAMLTGRLGEDVAFKYFMGKVSERSVKWVNETSETGLPYDIVLEGDEDNTEYIEVKATRFGRKNWFLITLREWQFAIEKGESFSIAHVIFENDTMATVTIYKNPARLCQLGSLKLALVVPKH